jgi:hypothetical protein
MGIHTKETAMDNGGSSFIVDLLAGLSLDLDDVSIVHDASRLPSESLLNTNRRAVGMEDFHALIFLTKETREKQNRWEVLNRTKKGDPKLEDLDPAFATNPAVKPGFGNGDSTLLRPIRRPSSPNSPGCLLTSEGIGGKITNPNTNDRRASSSISGETRRNYPKMAVPDSSSTTKPARWPCRSSGQSSGDSTLLRPSRRPSSPNSPTYLLTSEGIGGTIATGRRRHAQGVGESRSLSENIRVNISDLTLHSVVEDKEDIYEGSLGSLGTLDLEADGIDRNEHENERSLSIQDIEMRFCSRKESQKSNITATTQGTTSTSTSCLFEEVFSMSSTKINSSEEDDRTLGNQTKFLASCNDSREKNRKGCQSRETRHVNYNARRRLRAQGVRGTSPSPSSDF